MPKVKHYDAFSVARMMERTKCIIKVSKETPSFPRIRAVQLLERGRRISRFNFPVQTFQHQAARIEISYCRRRLSHQRASSRQEDHNEEVDSEY